MVVPPSREAMEMIARGEICAAKSIIALWHRLSSRPGKLIGELPQ